MPPAPDSATRDTILDAAERVFARQGFAATTVKQLGAEAGVNSALLYYYFADKETLYREVLRRMVADLTREGMSRMGAAADPEAAVRSLVGAQVAFLTAHPHRGALLIRELVDYQAAHAEEQLTQLATGLFRRLCDVIRQGQRDGRFRPDVDPQFAAISTIAQVVYLFVARPAVGLLLGHGTQGPPPATVAEFGRHAADFALAALAAPDASRVAPRARGGASARRARP